MDIRSDFYTTSDTFREARSSLLRARSYAYMTLCELANAAAATFAAISTHYRCESDILDGRVDLMEGEGPNDIG